MQPSEIETDTWVLNRGARVLPDGSVRFSVWAPSARRVAVQILSGSARGEHELERVSPVLFEGAVGRVRAGDDYKYVLTGEKDRREVPDPASRWQPQGVHGASRIVDPRAFRWTDQEWRGLPMRDYVIYELHVGTFTSAGTFEAVIDDLARLRGLGVTAIEIMPVAEFPGNRNWGYDGCYLYAPQSSYGGPTGLKTLVDAAHGAGLAVVLDVVYNHLGPEGNYLDAFGPFFTDRYRTPWGRAVNYDGAGSDDVRRFVIDNALYWVTEYHIDGLRLDAVHGIFDFGARHLLQELTDEVHAQATRLERTAVVIAESDLNDPRLIRSADEGGYGLDAQWSDDFHHAVHVALTGERSGYYMDFDGAEMIGAALREPFVYAGQFAPSRQRRHGAPSTGIPRDRFVVAIQNHDQVGNRAVGDRLSTLLSPEQLRLAAALLLLSPYVPLLFMGEEYGETNPFQYFISHGDTDLVEAVRKGRREEFAAFGWADAVPDPQAESTFEASRLDRTKLNDPRHAGMAELYRDLLAARRGGRDVAAAGRALSEHLEAFDVDYRDGVISLGAHLPDGGRRLMIFNCTDREQELALPEPTDSWQLVLSTDDARYGGEGRVSDRVRREELATVGARGRSSGEVQVTASASAAGAPSDDANPSSLFARHSSLPPFTAAIFIGGTT